MPDANTEVRLRNRFLHGLPREESARLLAQLKLTALTPGQVLFHPGERPKDIYFLLSGLASIVCIQRDARAIELALLDSEGPTGWFFLLGEADSIGECRVLVAGDALRMSLQDLQRNFDRSAVIRRRIMEMAAMKLHESYLNIACGTFHGAPQRLARWLLGASMRLKSTTIPITHERLSEALGSRRATVSLFLRSLTERGITAANRGVIEIRDMQALKRVACTCASTDHRNYRDLFHP